MALGDGVPLLEGRGLSKSFPGVQALREVDFAIRRRTVHMIVGENGAGKSTLVKIFSGVYRPESGELFLAGSPVRDWTPKVALKEGISTIYQEFNLVPDLSVAENVFLGRQPCTPRLRVLRPHELRRRTEELLERFGVDLDPTERIVRLGVAQRQMVEILRALSFGEERVLILDEPTASLSAREIESLFSIIRRLKEAGVGVLYITHRLDEIPQVGDDVTVMRDGRIVGALPAKTADRDQVIEWMIGHRLREFSRQAGGGPGEEVLTVRGASAPPHFEDVSLSLRLGEVLAIFGLVGAGRTEFVRALVGADRLKRGTVECRGRVVHISSPADAVKLHMGLAPEDRKRDGLVPERSLAENITLSAMRRCRRWGPVLDGGKVNRVAEEYVRRLGIRAPGLRARVKNLSGGNQQKTILARMLAANAEIVIFDEPTRGIDVGSKRDVYQLIDELAASGKAILMVSSDLDEVLRIGDRILVMREGRIAGEVAQAEATAEKIMRLALPESALSPLPTAGAAVE